MRTMTRSIALVLGLAALSLQARVVQARGEDGLKTQREAYVAAFNAQDAVRVAALYATDATFLPFTGQIVSGGASIAPAMVRVAGQVTLGLQPVSSAVSGDLAYESGTWSHVDRASGATVDGGAYTWVWRREPGGAWAIVSHAVTRKFAVK